MNSNQDQLISNLTVRLKDGEDSKALGTGVIYYNESLKDKIYVITASHCLLHQVPDRDPEDDYSFGEKLDVIFVDFYNPIDKKYETIEVSDINENLLFKDENKDIAVIIFNKKEVVEIVGAIPTIKVVDSRETYEKFVIKGFPNATQGQELAILNPTWGQEMTVVSKFQLQMSANEDYSSYNMEGFSGSGVFIMDADEVYLYGILTRYREEDKGKVIYCQYLTLVNELLQESFLPIVQKNYLRDKEFNHTFFRKHINESIENLSKRYSPELNFELPIAKLFNDLARDHDFKQRCIKIFDKWLTELPHKIPSSKEENKEVYAEHFNLKQEVVQWINTNPFDTIDTIDIDWIKDKVETLNELIQEQRSKLYEKQRELEKEREKTKKQYYGQSPLEREIYDLRQIENNNREFIGRTENHVNFKLANSPILLLKGDAGSGKSHLLGDIASNRLKEDKPSILLLGQHFRNGKNIEANIKELLGVSSSLEEILKSLNQIGKQLNERVPILIDALNEGAGITLWKDEVLGFINRVSNYPYIGLVLSIRTTYYDLLFPEELPNEVSIKEHKGFQGHEYEALKLFCKHHGLKQPDFPILTSEFAKPLFLLMICKGVQASPTKEFPQGFQGIEVIFNYYLSALEKQFKGFTNRDEYLLATNLVSKAVKKFSLKCFSHNRDRLLLNDTIDFFETNFNRYPRLLDDLIQNSVFIRNAGTNYETREREETITFVYQRFGDHIIANELLHKYQSKEEVVKVFQKNELLGELIENGEFRGVIEAFSILLPEKFNLELFEVYKWIFEQKEETKLYYTKNKINHFVIESFKWRALDSFDEKKLINWFKSEYFNLDDDQYLYCLLELATIKDHPFNSNRLYKILASYSMSERDGFWQMHIWSFNGYNDDNFAFPIRRLIDWAWLPEISFRVDEETTLLVAQVLAWVLSTTDRKLRDQTTKAMVNLLEQQPDALIQLLKKFKKVDDLYISERLYAIAYGCILRTKNNESVKKIGRYIYTSIFKGKNPPEHILLRDYARNIVEYVIYKNPKLFIDLKEVRPPYKSKLPNYPSEQDIAEYKGDHNSPNFDRIYNKIHFSVMDWDFGNKKVKPVLDNFYPIAFTKEKQYKQFLQRINKDYRKFLNDLTDMLLRKDKFSSMNSYEIDRLGKEKYEKWNKEIDKAVKKGYELVDVFFKGKSKYVSQEIITYLIDKSKLDKHNTSYKLFNTTPVRRWIVQRAFQLGYDIELHGHYDRLNEDRYTGRRAYTERIGKKYQWIAYHEMLAILTDNHKVNNRYSGEKHKYFKGVWQLNVRDIDPVYTKKDIDYGRNEEDEIIETTISTEWWSDELYNYWNYPDKEWVENITDLPEIKYIIQKTDDSKIDWLFLDKRVSWESPKPIGSEKYDATRKRIFFEIQGYVIKKRNKKSLIKFLKDKSFWSNWMPQNSDETNDLFNREKYWSPAYKGYDREESWQTIFYNHTSINLKVMPITVDAKAKIGEDNSNAESTYSMPCEELFKGMNLNYSVSDGDFEDESGTIVIQDIPLSGGLMIQKEKLIQYLEENNLDIIWTVMGEKQAIKSFRGDNNYSVPCGVFYLENGEVTGDLMYHEIEY